MVHASHSTITRLLIYYYMATSDLSLKMVEIIYMQQSKQIEELMTYYINMYIPSL